MKIPDKTNIIAEEKAEPVVVIAEEVETSEVAEDEAAVTIDFDMNLVKKYPNSNRKLSLSVAKFGISRVDEESLKNSHSVHISPHGIEFRTSSEIPEGTLLKIHVQMPDYWTRKQKFVDYQRIDEPTEFRLLAKVVKTEDVGKRGRKKLVLAQTLVIDSVDEQVLKNFLENE